MKKKIKSGRGGCRKKCMKERERGETKRERERKKVGEPTNR